MLADCPKIVEMKMFQQKDSGLLRSQKIFNQTYPGACLSITWKTTWKPVLSWCLPDILELNFLDSQSVYGRLGLMETCTHLKSSIGSGIGNGHVHGESLHLLAAFYCSWCQFNIMSKTCCLQELTIPIRIDCIILVTCCVKGKALNGFLSLFVLLNSLFLCMFLTLFQV